MNSKNIQKKVFVMMAACLMSLGVTAQVGPPDGDSDVDDSPISGFVVAGVAAAAALGLRKLRN